MKINENKYTEFLEQIYYVYFIPLDRKIRTNNGTFHRLVRVNSQTSLQNSLRDTYANLLHSNAKAL